MKRWIRSNWFLLALTSVYAAGHFGAESLAFLSDQSTLRSLIVMTVMWAMGITLRPDAIRASLREPSPSLLAIGVNIFVVPLLCLPAMWLLPVELAGGLFVAGLVPCTLASASVWTRKAGGDDSISIMTTTVTNLACLAVVPLGIQMVLALQTRMAPLDQMEKLAWFVVLPLVTAQVMRRFGLAGWADRNKFRLSLAAQFGILSMVLFGAIAGHDYFQTARVSLLAILAVIAAAVSVHLLALVIGIGISRQFGHSADKQIAVGISGSQKTLMVGLQIAIDSGVSVIPMLIYHLGQLFLDTMIASRWKRRHEAKRTPP
jgi:sodium/bile acid cotransporter 7